MNTADRSIAPIVHRHKASLRLRHASPTAVGGRVTEPAPRPDRLRSTGRVFVEYVPEDSLDLLPGHAYFLAADENHCAGASATSSCHSSTSTCAGDSSPGRFRPASRARHPQRHRDRRRRSHGQAQSLATRATDLGPSRVPAASSQAAPWFHPQLRQVVFHLPLSGRKLRSRQLRFF
jgi:hypothetical protein